MRACIAACRITVPQISPTFHLISFAPLTSSLPFHFVSFHLVSFYLISVSSHFISFHSIPRARPSALRCAKTRTVSDVFSYLCIFFLLVGVFYSARFARWSAERRREEEESEVLGFIPVVNNIFIAASSEEKHGVRSAIPGDVCRSRARRRHGTIELLRGITRSSPRRPDLRETKQAYDLHCLLQICISIFHIFCRKCTIEISYNLVTKSAREKKVTLSFINFLNTRRLTGTK